MKTNVIDNGIDDIKKNTIKKFFNSFRFFSVFITHNLFIIYVNNLFDCIYLILKSDFLPVMNV